MLRALLATALLALGTLPAVANQEEPIREKIDFICELRGYTCENVPVPEIKPIPEWQYNFKGIRGKYRLFMEPDAVYVYPGLSDKQYDVTLVHELAHYVDYKLGYMPVSAELWDEDKELYREYLCGSEGRAWHIGNTYAIYQGWDDLQTYGWYKWYENCELRHAE